MVWWAWSNQWKGLKSRAGAPWLRGDSACRQQPRPMPGSSGPSRRPAPQMPSAMSCHKPLNIHLPLVLGLWVSDTASFSINEDDSTMGGALSSYLHLAEPGLTDTPRPSGKADPTEHTWQAALAPGSPFPQRAGHLSGTGLLVP